MGGVESLVSGVRIPAGPPANSHAMLGQDFALGRSGFVFGLFWFCVVFDLVSGFKFSDCSASTRRLVY